MLGAAWPIGPVLGQVFRGFAYTGRTWVQSRGAEWSNVQVFKTSGRYVPSEDLIYAIVECFGPGGGGGWARPASGVESHPCAAGGGGSGGYSRKTLPAELIIQGADVLIGAGGLVGVGLAGGTVTGTNTNFGGLCVAHSGGDAFAFDGQQTLAAAYGTPGPGGALGIGDVALPGAMGGVWSGMTAILNQGSLAGCTPGMGGELFGGAQQPSAITGQSWLLSSGNGTNGLPNSGAGGGGAQVNAGSTTYFGGAGGSGLCVVTEICGTESDGGGGGGGPGPEPPGPGRPPGVPINVNARVTLIDEPCLPHPEQWIER